MTIMYLCTTYHVKYVRNNTKITFSFGSTDTGFETEPEFFLVKSKILVKIARDKTSKPECVFHFIFMGPAVKI